MKLEKNMNLFFVVKSLKIDYLGTAYLDDIILVKTKFAN